MKRFVKLDDPSSSKFWEIWVDDSTVLTRFGLAGGGGLTRLRHFASNHDAERACEKAIAEKIKKGFVEESSLSPQVASEGSFFDVLTRMMDDSNSVTASEATSCLIGILKSDVMSWEASGEAEALAKRMVWKFPDAGETLLWITRDGETFVSQLSTEFTSNSPWPWPGGSHLSRYFVFWEASNGWKYAGETAPLELIEEFGALLGEPQMILPWESIATRVVDEGFEEFASNYFPEFEEDSDERTKAETLYNFYSQIADMSLELPDEMGEVVYDYGDGFLPRYSKAGRFNAFLGELEDEYGWGIIFDECCGTCASSSVNDLRQQEGMEEASFFITWGQNAEGTWGPSGWVSHMAYHPDKEERRIIRSVATSHGLTVREEEKDGEKDGFLYIS